MEQDHALLKSLVDQIPLGAGVVCYTHDSVSCSQLLQNRGLNLPTDVKLISADEDTLFTLSSTPTISAVTACGTSMGQLTFQTLLDLHAYDIPRCNYNNLMTSSFEKVVRPHSIQTLRWKLLSPSSDEEFTKYVGRERSTRSPPVRSTIT